MEEEMIIHRLTTIFRKVFNDDTIVLDNKLTANDIGTWDSLTHMLMITDVENTFSIKFSLREINKLKDAGTLINLIESKLAS
jgi:acyl carrier protein